MSVAVSPSMPETSPFADMSPAVVSMLRDEANLSTAQHVLEDARQDFLNNLESLQAQRPAFGFLAGKKQRDDYAHSLNVLETQLRSIDHMIGRVTAARERMQPALRAGLIDHLNRSDPTYRHGLRASRFHEHWRRSHAVVSDRLKAFLRDCRETRNALANDAASARTRHSGDAVWNLTNARNAAAELDREIDALNAVALEHQKFVEGTPFSDIRLPVIEKWDCIQKVDALTLKSPGLAVADADHLIGEFSELRQPSLMTMFGMFEAVAGEHAQLAESRLRQNWSTLLAHAEAHLVSDAELEPTLADIERRQAESERKRIVSQISRPFDSER